MSPPSRFRSHRAALVLIALATLAVYANALRGGFLWDDRFLIEQNALIRDWRNLPRLFLNPLTPQFYQCYRPLTNLSLMASYSVWHLNPFGYHLESILLHLVNACLVYGVVFVVSRERALAFATGLLFAVHPVLTEPVNYLSSRADLLAGCFLLLTVLLYARSRTESSRRNFWYAGAVGSFVCGVLSKEFVMILPGLLLMYEWVCRPPTKVSSRGACRAVWPFIFIAAGYGLLRLTLLNFSPPSSFQPTQTIADISLIKRVVTALATIPTSVRLLLWPTGLHKAWWVPVIDSPADGRVIGTLALLVGLVWLARWSWRSTRMPAFGLLWFGLLMVPHLNLVPLNAFFSEGWLYMPAVGFLIFVSSLVLSRCSRTPGGNRRLLIGTLAVAVAVSSALTIQRNRVWAGDPEAFYADTLRHNPHEDRIHVELGNLYFRQGKTDEAEAAYRQALALHPRNPSAHSNLGNVYLRQGSLEEARAAFEQALALKPEFPVAHYNAGLVAMRQGQVERAIELFQKALERDPHLMEAHYQLGRAYASRQRLPDAMTALTRAITLNPSHAPSHHQLGTVYAKLGRLTEAVSELQAALRLNPETADVHHDLGSAYIQQGAFPQALGAYTEALRLNPQYGTAHYHLGMVYAKLGRPREAAWHLRAALALFQERGQDAFARLAEEALQRIHPEEP